MPPYVRTPPPPQLPPGHHGNFEFALGLTFSSNFAPLSLGWARVDTVSSTYFGTPREVRRVSTAFVPAACIAVAHCLVIDISPTSRYYDDAGVGVSVVLGVFFAGISFPSRQRKFEHHLGTKAQGYENITKPLPFAPRGNSVDNCNTPGHFFSRFFFNIWPLSHWECPEVLCFANNLYRPPGRSLDLQYSNHQR